MGSGMRILQVNTCDCRGGAARVAWLLHRELAAIGHELWMTVRTKDSDDPHVLAIDQNDPRVLARLRRVFGRGFAELEPRLPGLWRLRGGIKWLEGLPSALPRRMGREVFAYPGSRQIFRMLPRIPDVVHMHNLHGGYFDLRFVARFSRQIPSLITLHDQWTYTGHCAHSFACERWREGCGNCPDLGIYPAVERDGTARNWKLKRRLYEQSRLHIVTPCQWLADRAKASVLGAAATGFTVIPYGVDQAVFCTGDRDEARRALGLPEDARVILCVADSIKTNPFKNYAMIDATCAILGGRERAAGAWLIALGAREAQCREVGRIRIVDVPFLTEPKLAAQYYRAADVYIHPARADTFPNAVLEALCCGTPVVATAVGGIIEQITHGQTGYLVETGDSHGMAHAVEAILADEVMRRYMSGNAAAVGAERYSLGRMVSDYGVLFEKSLSCRDVGGKHGQ